MSGLCKVSCVFYELTNNQIIMGLRQFVHPENLDEEIVADKTERDYWKGKEKKRRKRSRRSSDRRLRNIIYINDN